MKNGLLFVTDEGGKILFSAGKKVSAKVKVTLAELVNRGARGTELLCGKPVYIKEILLQNRRFIFFLNYNRLCDCFGTTEAARAAESLFAPEVLRQQKQMELSVAALCCHFENMFRTTLDDSQIRLEIHKLRSDAVVLVRPNALALVLSLMVRLCAAAGGHVRITLLKSAGKVRFFVDCMGDKPAAPPEGCELLKTLLCEVCAAVGFGISDSVYNGVPSYTLEIEPLDISLLGLKAESFVRFKAAYAFYVGLCE